MKRSGPLLTLLAGLLLALFTLSLNATTETGSSSYGRQTQTPDASTSAEKPSEKPGEKPGEKKPGGKPSEKPTKRPERKPPPDAQYAGRTDDDTAAVSVSVRDGRAVAYFCDGHDTESWLKGKVEDDGSMRLTGKHGAKLTGRIADDKVRGTVDIDKETWKFTARKAVKPSGLYRATTEVRGAKLDGGWIVLADGSQVGILTRDGKRAPAPRLDPRTGAVRVGSDVLTARPVAP
ncbi:hypothetical protein ABZ953_26840 [Streptomyces sp. NPDC046465]|uniref:hypothetical protein n=1 Tax=Streptomyces sp. NPDC046465 TaxID=3155810 RepID=UPI0033DF7FD0